jgi:hypothetical protein
VNATPEHSTSRSDGSRSRRRRPLSRLVLVAALAAAAAVLTGAGPLSAPTPADTAIIRVFVGGSVPPGDADYISRGSSWAGGPLATPDGSHWA